MRRSLLRSLELRVAALERAVKVGDHVPTKLPEGDLVTIEQARVIAGVSRRTIYNWIESGRLQQRFTLGGSPRFDRNELFMDGK